MTWNTLYDYNKSKIYLHLTNNDLLVLNFSISVQNDDISKYNLENNQQLTSLTSPPSNSTLFIFNDNLYALISDRNTKSSNLDLCGNGIISIVKYNENLNTWTNSKLNLNLNDILDGSFYSYPTILTNPTNNETIYLYGGICQDSAEVSSRLLSIDLNNGKISNITTSTKPQPFYGASNLISPNPQTQLVIGGQSTFGGWLNMYQLATWDFDSGWSFKQINKINDEQLINSRKFPLVLPIFKPINNNSSNSIYDTLQINEILMIGGEMEHEQLSTPIYSKLYMNLNNWYWNYTESNLQLDEILGAATIFNTLVVVNSTDINKRDGNKIEYKVNLYDTNTFTEVKSIKENTEIPTITNTTKSSSNKNKIILGTVIPIISIFIIAGFIIFYILKRKKSKQEETYNEEVEYKFNYLNPPSIGHEEHSPMYINVNDSSSTLSGQASIDSWMKKRQDYDINKQKIRNSYLASNETLNMVDDEEMREVDLSENLPIITTKPVHKSVRNLKKSFSFSNTPPTSPLITKKSQKLQSLRLTSTEQLINPTEYDSDNEINENEQDLVSVDDQMDVQVLVSSKRRSILKVVNPDVTEDNEEDQTYPEILEEDEHMQNKSSVYDDESDRFSQVIEKHFDSIIDNNGESNKDNLRLRTPSGRFKVE
ncbi:unnamed protein product [Candida verbasci]|uniref:Galactose oxidase n=1 Tax=Candida verbasci TaxID=1227364 RepID=A0A9W4TR90_9ASCO|nr:unnamed protein product [Candida verbasci]